MPVTMACIAGATVYKMLQGGQLVARELPRRSTPFGQSNPIFQAEGDVPYLVMPRHGPGRERPAPWQVNYRANLYALKDLGVQSVLSWSAAGAITHSLAPGFLVVPDDVIDMTHNRPSTFFENSCLGYLRQFPVFCPALQKRLGRLLLDMKLPLEVAVTAAVTEGPRLETPAEIRMLATAGAKVVTHTLAPDVFLAKELQMCFAGLCYVVNFAETGSLHRPFTAGMLFNGGMEPATSKIAKVASRLPEIMARLAESLLQKEPCECDRTMAESVQRYNLSDDWRTWFTTAGCGEDCCQNR